MGAFPPVDTEKFIRITIEKMGDSVPMLPLVLKKQASDLGLSGPVPPAKIELLIKKTVTAIEYFSGKEDAVRVRRYMKKILKAMAPEYFKSKYML